MDFISEHTTGTIDFVFFFAIQAQWIKSPKMKSQTP
jgi:hypothetical protein